ncbi:thiolase family protein [Desulfoscipio gibsoniae]|uniref:Acetyl-CoA acetyltransferase n=1 Tax=Desulfoscipio gibsoniae DSM 7213 TaxID=767817 RepID=R4KBM7_9FIRM|nr:acetyl-CoA C-acyltransferase [Desulfoscipio gibsoniae]AGK99983.1 acetyl-CoA acetyltransferase [Desulfoscipio gibsoniae DSM 7213]
MREAVIVSAVRTAVGKAPRGKLKNTRPEYMGAEVIKALIARTPGLEPAEIDDVIFGCSFPEAEQGMNIGRMLVLRTGLPHSVPGATINRFCSSGLESIAIGATRVMAGFADIYLCGGVENMSMVPIGGHKCMPDPELMVSCPQAYINMGLTAENVAQMYNISRQEQDEYSVASHAKAANAIKEGRFKEQIVPLTITNKTRSNGRLVEKTFTFDTDEGVRPGTTLEILGELRPVFKAGGSVTAGNSSQTSDGAAAVMIMSREKADSLGLKPMAVFRSYAVGGCPPEIMGMGPTVAIPRALKMAGIAKDQVDVFELNEAFAVQALACIKVLELDPGKVNFNGGAVALGHPLGCTGSKLTTQLVYEMKRQNAHYGVVSMCIGGGMGAAAVFENVD